MDRIDVALIGIFASVPVVGVVSAIAAEKTITKYGHTFGPTSLVLIGLIGAVQNAVSLFFSLYLYEKKMDNVSWYSLFLLNHVLTGIVLAGLTNGAAKLNLIAARLNMIAVLALVASSIVENSATIYLGQKIIKFVE